MNIQIRSHTQATDDNPTTVGTNQNKAARCTPHPRQRATNEPAALVNAPRTTRNHSTTVGTNQNKAARCTHPRQRATTRRSRQLSTHHAHRKPLCSESGHLLLPQTQDSLRRGDLARQIDRKAGGFVPSAGAPGRRSSAWGRARGRRRRRRMRRRGVPGTPCCAAVIGGCARVSSGGGSAVVRGFAREGKRSDDEREEEEEEASWARSGSQEKRGVKAKEAFEKSGAKRASGRRGDWRVPFRSGGAEVIRRGGGAVPWTRGGGKGKETGWARLACLPTPPARCEPRASARGLVGQVLDRARRRAAETLVIRAGQCHAAWFYCTAREARGLHGAGTRTDRLPPPRSPYEYGWQWQLLLLPAFAGAWGSPRRRVSRLDLRSSCLSGLLRRMEMAGGIAHAARTRHPVLRGSPTYYLVWKVDVDRNALAHHRVLIPCATVDHTSAPGS